MVKQAHKWFALSLVCTLMLAGCSQRPAEPDPPAQGASGTSASGGGTSTAAKKTLTVYSTVSDQPIQELYKQIGDNFTKENPDIAVNFQFPGSGYENNMKVKMAARDLPDVFDTHGWAQIRYGDYLLDLKDEPWAKNLTDTIKNVVTDKNGKVYALVLSEAKDGLMYNADMLSKYGIEPPKTFDDLIAAGEKIKKESGGKTIPFFFSGVDDGMIGQYFDYFATSLLISPKDNQADALLKGTFDWNKWTPLPQKLLDLKNKGLINEDVLTAKYSDLPKAFADERTAFALQGPSFVEEVHKLKPELKVGFMPIPSMVAGDEPTFSGGERFTMGIWKESKNIPEAKKLLAFFAKPENMSKIANATKLPPGLKGVDSKHEFSDYYNKYSSIRVFPYFDRVYLPNGMWDVLCKTGTELLAGRITPQQYSDTMKREFERLSKK